MQRQTEEELDREHQGLDRSGLHLRQNEASSACAESTKEASSTYVNPLCLLSRHQHSRPRSVSDHRSLRGRPVIVCTCVFVCGASFEIPRAVSGLESKLVLSYACTHVCRRARLNHEGIYATGGILL